MIRDLDDIVAKVIEDKLKYTVEELEKLKKITHVNLHGFVLRIGDNPEWFYTREGIEIQVAHFKEQPGIIYFWQFTNGKPDIHPMAVTKLRPVFYPALE